MNDSRLDAGLRPGISTFPMKHQILTIRLSLQPVFRFCRQIYTQPLRTRNPAPVGYFRCADAAGVPDRPAAGNGLPRHEANLRQVLYPNRDVGTSAQQFLCGSLPQTGRNCTATPSGSTPRTSPTIRPDGRPPLQLLDEEGSGCPEAPCRPDGQETCISMPGTRSNARRHAVQTI